MAEQVQSCHAAVLECKLLVPVVTNQVNLAYSRLIKVREIVDSKRAVITAAMDLAKGAEDFIIRQKLSESNTQLQQISITLDALVANFDLTLATISSLDQTAKMAEVDRVHKVIIQGIERGVDLSWILNPPSSTPEALPEKVSAAEISSGFAQSFLIVARGPLAKPAKATALYQMSQQADLLTPAEFLNLISQLSSPKEDVRESWVGSDLQALGAKHIDHQNYPLHLATVLNLSKRVSGPVPHDWQSQCFLALDYIFDGFTLRLNGGKRRWSWTPEVRDDLRAALYKMIGNIAEGKKAIP